jgi:hypothetical protein
MRTLGLEVKSMTFTATAGSDGSVGHLKIFSSVSMFMRISKPVREGTGNIPMARIGVLHGAVHVSSGTSS